MQTPQSTEAMEQDWPAFIQNIYRRLEMGRLTYGDESFDKPLTTLIHEIEQELFDVTGWSFIMWSRLQRIKDQLRAVQNVPDGTAGISTQRSGEMCCNGRNGNGLSGGAHAGAMGD